jgi:hypothetical protein
MMATGPVKGAEPDQAESVPFADGAHKMHADLVGILLTRRCPFLPPLYHEGSGPAASRDPAYPALAGRGMVSFNLFIEKGFLDCIADFMGLIGPPHIRGLHLA